MACSINISLQYAALAISGTILNLNMPAIISHHYSATRSWSCKLWCAVFLSAFPDNLISQEEGSSSLIFLTWLSDAFSIKYSQMKLARNILSHDYYNLWLKDGLCWDSFVTTFLWKRNYIALDSGSIQSTSRYCLSQWWKELVPFLIVLGFTMKWAFSKRLL